MGFESHTAEEKAQLFTSAMGNADGRRFIAERMAEPIKQERDYTSLGRQGLILDPIGQGEVPYYDIDVKTRAVVLSQRGEVPQERVNIQRVLLDFFPIASYPLVPIIDTKLRRYNALDRVQVKARADLAEEEDRLIFGDPSAAPDYTTTYGGQNTQARGGVSLYRAATPASTTEVINTATGVTYGYGGNVWDDAYDHRPNTVFKSNTGVTKELITGAMGEILAHDLQPEAIILNPRDYTDLLLWGRDEVDTETQREVIQTGRMGKIFNLQVHMSKICPSGTAYIRTADQYLGVMPILIDLDVMDAPDTKGLNYGFVFYEYISMAILNTWGVCRMSINHNAL